MTQKIKEKNPQNKNSLPKIIISDFNNSCINEIKIKYFKHSRLDKITINKMSLNKENELIFEEVLLNNDKENIRISSNKKQLLIETENKNYKISAIKIKNDKNILFFKKGNKKVRFIVDKKDSKYYKKDGSELLVEEKDIIEYRQSFDKFEVFLEDLNSNRKTSSQRELITQNTKSIYERISGISNPSSQDIYKIKRFISYRSDMLFFYSFVDSFFKDINNIELWKLDFNKKINEPLIDFFTFQINDNLKNDKKPLFDYIKNKDHIKHDLIKVKNLFYNFRHALVHFDYKYIEELLSNKNTSMDLNINFLNTLIEKNNFILKKDRKNFLEDEEISIFEDKNKTQVYYDFFNELSTKLASFNSIINSFIAKNGIENKELKEFLKSKGISYFNDIHEDKENYKKIYNEHKKEVTKLSYLEDGNEIHKTNQNISKLKDKMNKITKENSIKKLEVKLRLIFGFIKKEFNNFENFRKNFENESKKTQFQNKIKNINIEIIKEYYNITFDKKIQFFVHHKGKNKIYDKPHGYNLKDFIKDDNLLKFIFLFYIFIPSELKSDFLGFIKKFYHDTKNIENDTINEKEDIFKSNITTSQKLKLLERFIKNQTILKYSLNTKYNYEKTNNKFIEKGSPNKKTFSSLGISHNIQEFEKTLVSNIYKYNSYIFKLISDFEIFLILKDNSNTKTIKEVIETQKYHFGKHYNFLTLLLNTKVLSHKNHDIIKLRNFISHNAPLNFEETKDKFVNINKIKEQRINILNLISKQKEINQTLMYNPINDFTMKVIHLQIKLKQLSNKTEKLKELQTKAQTPNDFYNIYKLKAIEVINKYLLDVFNETYEEKITKNMIKKGNKKF